MKPNKTPYPKSPLKAINEFSGVFPMMPEVPVVIRYLKGTLYVAPLLSVYVLCSCGFKPVRVTVKRRLISYEKERKRKEGTKEGGR